MKPEFIRQGPKLSEAKLAAIEKKCGVQLPKDYRDFMLEKNGGEPDPTGVCRKRSKTPYLSCRYLFSIAAERPLEDWISWYEGMKDEDEPTLPNRLIPIGVDHGDNVFCLSLSGKDAGKVYWWDHENSFVPDPPKRVIPDMTGISLVADSFEKFLNQFAEEPDEFPEIKTSAWVALVKSRDQRKLAAWLKYGGKWNERDSKIGRSPLELAVELDSWPTVKLLLKHNASLQKAFEHAVQVNRWDLVRTLQKHAKPRTLKPNTRVLKETMESCNDVGIVTRMLDDGAPIHAAPFKHNLLYYATMFNNNPEIISLLIKRRARLTQKAEGQTALANAICNGAFDAVKLLLKAGENLYEAPKIKTRMERAWEEHIKELQSKRRPNRRLIEMVRLNLADEQQKRLQQAPIYAFDQPWKKLPPNFKKDVIAYAAKLGQTPPET
jgi:ankyrin repeat protein